MKKIDNYFTLQEIIFITTMVAIDIGSGIFMKPLLGALGVTAFIRIDMILPLTIIFFTRKKIGKFGTIILYEFLWAFSASFVMPMSFDTPGILKLLPAFIFAITFEVLFYYLPKKYNINMWGAAIIGVIINQFTLLGVKILLGLPFLNIVKVSFAVQSVSIIGVALFSVYMALLLLRRFSSEKFNLLFRNIDFQK